VYRVNFDNPDDTVELISRVATIDQSFATDLSINKLQISSYEILRTEIEGEYRIVIQDAGFGLHFIPIGDSGLLDHPNHYDVDLRALFAVDGANV
jgi:hypothetical protein